MSIYSTKGKGWRYDFMLNGVRYTHAWYDTKKKATQAAAERRKEVLEPPTKVETPTDMDFLELVNLRLDHIKAYNSKQHYEDYHSRAKRWVQLWGPYKSSEITRQKWASCQRWPPVTHTIYARPHKVRRWARRTVCLSNIDLE